MNVSGVNGGIAAYRALGGLAGAQPARPAAPAAPAAPARPAAPAHAARGSSSAADAVPAGSDPALWSILTSQERDFFLKQASMGPVTYGPAARRAGAAPAAGAPIGQRIDVRG